jgi:enoyl-CoA hydratase/3-hydroxyacyl-CoA dehydrogenase
MFVFKAAVVGAGTMGGDIAQVIAAADIPVVLKDADAERVEQALERARSLWQSQVDAGKLEAAALERRLALITVTTDYAPFADVDFVIEAVPEDIDTKRTVFSELDAVTPGHAILASNTSTLSITELGEATGRPDRVVGFHFFAPAAKVRLIEVVEGEDTSGQTAQAASNFAQAIRKLPIRCGDAPGFVVNRIVDSADAEVRAAHQPGADPPALAALVAAVNAAAKDPGAAEPGIDAGHVDRFTLRALVESCLVVEEGVAAMKDVELGVMAGAGIVPPPLQRADRAGLDEVLARLERAAAEWGESYEPPIILRRLVAQGRLGVKAGQGFFAYPRPDSGWDQSPVKLETRGEVAIAWLDRPPANSLSPEVVAALRELWAAVAGSAVRALVFASANPALFCAGADIKAFTTLDDAAGRRLVNDMHGLLRDMERSSVLTIAAVNALAYGGGCELAMGCDLRIAAESASFGQPEINLGIIPGFGGTQRLPRLVGEARALELNLTGDPIGAEEACELGLATRVVPDQELLDTALAWARKLAGQAPLAVQQIKRVSAAGDLDAGIEAEKEGFATVFGSDDAREGISAFLQKRGPRFEGK